MHLTMFAATFRGILGGESDLAEPYAGFATQRVRRSTMTSRWAGLAVFLLLAVAWTSLSTTGCDPCSSCSSGGGKPTASPTPAPSSATGQGLIAIDTGHHVGYVPISTLAAGGGVVNARDGSTPAVSVPGSSQLAVVDLTI